jgi:tetratricopeptide (TPR) repeat protein
MSRLPARCTPFLAVIALALMVGACSSDSAPADRETAVLTRAPLPPGTEAISFLGDTLMPPVQPDEVRAVYMARYREAEEALAASPEDVDALIWMGRRTAYLGRYRDAIDIYSDAIAMHPDDPRLYRHRGHRYLSVREPEHAISDFERAAELTDGLPDEVEPDGLPNAMNIPTSTLQFNIWYHLALAHYVQGHLEAALEAQRNCLEVSVHPDSVVATSYWLYMTLRRLGMDDEAQEVLDGIHEDMEIIESIAYLDLLLLFKGERTLEDLLGPSGDAATLQSTTTAYGLGVWHLLGGRTAEAHETWERILTGRNQWSAFGYIAAEGELARSAIR